MLLRIKLSRYCDFALLWVINCILYQGHGALDEPFLIWDNFSWYVVFNVFFKIISQYQLDLLIRRNLHLLHIYDLKYALMEVKFRILSHKSVLEELVPILQLLDLILYYLASRVILLQLCQKVFHHIHIAVFKIIIHMHGVV